ncbi:PREDICTED: uncharacterized protein LOC106103777 isoform X2 [Papilio polytes]|uniref:uncharacterized protein LOC106103777 isoform X2 n=1 Tax=Papilio polytes TaxID=76194 RepID=UPI000675F13D|nr:PREDICTED: uncharacterized protein LOC106103777 isoform X2 [Papilio polytes]
MLNDIQRNGSSGLAGTSTWSSMPIEIRNTIENAVALRAFEKEKMFLVLSGRYLRHRHGKVNSMARGQGAGTSLSPVSWSSTVALLLAWYKFTQRISLISKTIFVNNLKQDV